MNLNDMVETFLASDNHQALYELSEIMGRPQPMNQIGKIEGPYVYIIMDPRTSQFETSNWIFKYKPFYVGKGRNERFKDKKNKAVQGKIRSIRKDGLEPVVSIWNYDTDQEAYITEKEMVDCIGRISFGGPLLNMTDGGIGGFGNLPPWTGGKRIGFVPWNKGLKKPKKPLKGYNQNWIVVAPDGAETFTNNLKQYAANHGICYQNLSRSSRSNIKCSGYKARKII